MTATKLPERLSAETAEHVGLVPRGCVWDEDTQQAIPLAVAVRETSIARGEDLEARAQRFVRERKALLGFIASQMQEAEYEKDGRPIKGKLHDFYILPGYDKKALTKPGSEKLAGFFNLRQKSRQSVERECTKDFTRAVVRVELVDKWGQPAGAGEAAANTAERGFQGAAKKYNGDWRAAENDVLARAGKRAFVQAVVYATATDEMFDASGDVERAAEAKGVTEDVETETGPRFPAKFGSLSGKLLSEVTDEDLARVADWCRTKAKNPKAVQPIADAVTEEQERRRLEREGTDEPDL